MRRIVHWKTGFSVVPSPVIGIAPRPFLVVRYVCLQRVGVLTRTLVWCADTCFIVKEFFFFFLSPHVYGKEAHICKHPRFGILSERMYLLYSKAICLDLQTFGFQYYNTLKNWAIPLTQTHKILISHLNNTVCPYSWAKSGVAIRLVWDIKAIMYFDTGV